MVSSTSFRPANYVMDVFFNCRGWELLLAKVHFHILLQMSKTPDVSSLDSPYENSAEADSDKQLV